MIDNDVMKPMMEKNFIRGRRDAECTGGFGRAGRGDLRLMSDGH